MISYKDPHDIFYLKSCIKRCMLTATQKLLSAWSLEFLKELMWKMVSIPDNHDFWGSSQSHYPIQGWRPALPPKLISPYGCLILTQDQTRAQQCLHWGVGSGQWKACVCSGRGMVHWGEILLFTLHLIILFKFLPWNVLFL